MLRRAPGFTAAALVTLAIGIGANVAVFSVVNAVLLKPLPYPQSDQLVALWHSAPGAPDRAGGLNLSPSMFFTYADENHTFQNVGLWISGSTTVTGLAEPEEVRSILVTHGVLEALNVQPVLGRWLDQSDQTPQGPATLMVTYGYWHRRFGGDPSVIGRTITVGSRPREIVGVMPEGFRVLDTEADVIVPFSFDRRRLLLSGFVYNGIARLKPGMTFAEANADIARMLPIWMSSWRSLPGADPAVLASWKITPAVRPLKQEVVGEMGRVLWIVMATVGVVMLIACANVANLLLVRGEVRQRELAVRAALGAGTGRVIRELLLESAWLGLIGGLLGLALASIGLRTLVWTAPADLPRLSEISLDPRALAFAIALSLLSILVFGLLPAIKSAHPRISHVLHSGGRALSGSRERVRARNVLVVAQVALAVVLLVSAVLMIRSFQALLAVAPGFAEPRFLQTTRISIPAPAVQQPMEVARMQHSILDKLAAIPGVASVAFSSSMPLEESPPWEGLEAEGASVSESAPPRRLKFVSPGLFQTTGTPLVAGRDFTWTDIYDGRPVAMVSENLARELWATPLAALGKRIRFGGDTLWRDVIGVSTDVHDNGVDAPPPTTVYWPVMVSGFSSTAPLFIARSVTFAIRSPQAGTPAFLRDVQAAVWSVNKNLALTSVHTMQDAYDRSLARTSFTLVTLTIAATIALVLAVVGVYGTIAYVVSLRTRETGIRLALGLEPAAVVRMFVSHGLFLVSIGVLIGLGIAVGATRLLAFLLFGIHQVDPVTYLVVPSVLASAAVIASYIPARRAAALDPVEALKLE